MPNKNYRAADYHTWDDAGLEYVNQEDDENEEEDASCDRCQALMIQNLYCHETGCPNQGKVKVDGEWVRPESDEDEDEEDYSAEELLDMYADNENCE